METALLQWVRVRVRLRDPFLFHERVPDGCVQPFFLGKRKGEKGVFYIVITVICIFRTSR